MAHMLIRPFHPDDEDAVIRLWEACGLVVPQNDPHRDIARKLGERGDLFLVGCLDGEVVATVMAGYEGHRGWVNYLAVGPRHRRRGIGRAMMGEAERLLGDAGSPKINLQVRNGNREAIAFYRRIGYEVDEAISLGKRLERDT